ncbi:hypothetical protein ACFL60_00295 [Candidatus Omnitrophota bacterium]
MCFCVIQASAFWGHRCDERAWCPDNEVVGTSQILHFVQDRPDPEERSDEGRGTTMSEIFLAGKNFASPRSAGLGGTRDVTYLFK